MQKDLNIKKIQSKFHEIIQLDETKKDDGTKRVDHQQFMNSILSPNSSAQNQKQETRKAKKEEPNAPKDQLVFTKSDICREVAKLKPYLKNYNESLTSVEQEDKTNKKISGEEQNSLSLLVIYLNKELCEQLKNIQKEQSQNMRRQTRQKEGWVYQVFYRYSQVQQASQLPQTVFKNGYVVLTEVMELFPNLTFEQSEIRININEITRVKYLQEREYQIIDIRFNDLALHVGFLNQTQMKLFDRMLFLLKNMARTSSTRLFQNQLLKNIYSEY